MMGHFSLRVETGKFFTISGISIGLPGTRFQVLRLPVSSVSLIIATQGDAQKIDEERCQQSAERENAPKSKSSVSPMISDKRAKQEVYHDQKGLHVGASSSVSPRLSGEVSGLVLCGRAIGARFRCVVSENLQRLPAHAFVLIAGTGQAGAIIRSRDEPVRVRVENIAGLFGGW